MSMPEIIFNFESPQTETLGNFTIVSGCEFILVNLTCHNLLYGCDEDSLVDSIVRTINHEVIHHLMSQVCVEANQEMLVERIDNWLFPSLIADRSKFISKKERYKLESLAGYE